MDRNLAVLNSLVRTCQILTPPSTFSGNLRSRLNGPQQKDHWEQPMDLFQTNQHGSPHPALDFLQRVSIQPDQSNE